MRDNSAYLIVGQCIFFLDNYRYLIVDEASRTCLDVIHRMPIFFFCQFFVFDNYSYLIVDEASRTCLAVDPADAKALHNAILKENLMLSGILTT